jgi:hypothetical protein
MPPTRPGGARGLATWGLPCPLLLPLLASFPFPLLSPGAWCCARTVPARCGPGGPFVAVIALRPLACFCPRLRAAWPCGWPLARVTSAGPLLCALVSVAPCGGLARWPPPRRPGLVRSCCPRTPPPPLAAPPWRALIAPWRCKAPELLLAPPLGGCALDLPLPPGPLWLWASPWSGGLWPWALGLLALRRVVRPWGWRLRVAGIARAARRRALWCRWVPAPRRRLALARWAVAVGGQVLVSGAALAVLFFLGWLWG